MMLSYYEFRLRSVAHQEQAMDVFGVRYKVKGPQKDYTSAILPNSAHGDPD